jgi:hypothetical protein
MIEDHYFMLADALDSLTEPEVAVFLAALSLVLCERVGNVGTVADAIGAATDAVRHEGRREHTNEGL